MEDLIADIRSIRYPGLTREAAAVPELADSLSRELAVIFYKSTVRSVWVMFLGGTGTGKSTLFNLFCASTLSATGVERPRTSGPIAFAHLPALLGENFPFSRLQIGDPVPVDSPTLPESGVPGRLSVIGHSLNDFSHLVVVDTPDVDSVEESNRLITRDLRLLADVVIFVATPEKYADEVPLDALYDEFSEKKGIYYLLNKVRGDLGPEDVLKVLRGRGIELDKKRIWGLPHVAGGDARELSTREEIQRCMGDLRGALAPPRAEEVFQKQQERRKERVQRRAGQLLELLRAEHLAALSWREKLADISVEISAFLIQAEQERFKSRSDEYIRIEIRKLFSRYDPLARPRRLIQGIVLFPLRFLGLWKADRGERHRQAVERLRKTQDLTALFTAIEQFNRRVLEELSPPDSAAPLSLAMRQPELELSEETVEDRVLRQQEDLLAWIEERFQHLSEHLSKRKKWGIYSASVLWGVLLLGVETVLGGGFTMVDAILDSALAPFVTKGTTELFAFHEIQKITRDLAERYRHGLTDIVEEQRKAYEGCLEGLLMSPDELRTLEERLQSAQKNQDGPFTPNQRG